MRLLGLIALGAVIFAAESRVLGEPARPPNIVVILIDDLGFGDVAFNGCKDIPTPSIDALAAGGVRCTNGYVTAPSCVPSRAGLLTGRYQQRYGCEFNGSIKGVPESEKTLADALRAAGYATGAVGKWHLGTAEQFHPLRRGFDEFFGCLEGAHHYLPDAQVPKPATPADAFIAKVTARDRIVRGREPVHVNEYLTDVFGEEAAAFVARHEKEPFLLYLAFNAVHVPLEATEKYLARFPNIAEPKRRTYAAMVSAVDDAIGRLMHTLEDKKLDRDTLVFFLSDNGGQETQGGASNGGLRGAKASLFEGGIRVPFVVRWRGRVEPGVCDEPVIAIDLFPTALAAAGRAVPPALKLDGVDLLPVLRGEAAPRRALFWRYGEAHAVRQGDWKLVVAKSGEKASCFNLREDRGETRDRATDEPERVKQLSALYETWDAQLPRPKPEPGFFGRGARPE